jgi:predicted nucleic acid-binding Zn ribbon protein
MNLPLPAGVVTRANASGNGLPSKRMDIMANTLAPKRVTCQCGNSFESSKSRSWCQQCCAPVYYYEKDQRRHKINNYYMITVIALVLMFITYIFVEMIAEPLMSL